MRSTILQRTATLLMRSAAAASVLAMMGAMPAAASGWNYNPPPKCGYGDYCQPKKHEPKCYDRCQKPCYDRCPKPCYDRCGYGNPCTSHQPGYQNADVDANAVTHVNSVINAGSQNTTGIHQSGGGGYGWWGGGFQNADVDNNAQTHVNSNINAGSLNDIGVLQSGGGWGGYQNATVNANALTGVNSQINAGSANMTGISQTGGGFQNANVDNNAYTGVHSQINAGSANMVDIVQL